MKIRKRKYTFGREGIIFYFLFLSSSSYNISATMSLIISEIDEGHARYVGI